MRYFFEVDRQRGRVYSRACGIWDVELARTFLRDATEAAAWAKTVDSPIRMFTDLNGMTILPLDASPIVSRGTDLLNGIGFERYAMVAPAALMRMQVRRIDKCSYVLHDTVEEALEWLGWPDFVPIEHRSVEEVAGSRANYRGVTRLRERALG